jgi:undecaprenyl-diphosphatase
MVDHRPPSERRETPRGSFSVFKDALYSMLRWIGRHVRGFYGAVLAFLTLGLVVGLAAATVFGAFATVVAEGLTQGFDERVLRWIAGHRSPTMDEVMLEITTLGNGAVLVMLVLVASVFLWLTKHRWSVALLLLAVLGGKVLNTALKEIFDRPRPSVVDAVDTVSSMSFPSGHAMSSFVTYGAVAYLVGRLEPTRTLRIVTWTLASLIILAIGVSRMYLGVHYPSDILAGFLGGLAWLAFVAAGMTAVRFFSPRKPDIEEEEKDVHAEEERAAGVRE